MAQQVDANRAYAMVVSRSGKTKAEISRELGKTNCYIGATISRGTMPSLDQFVRTAQVCGWKVKMTDGTDEMTIRPTRRD